MNVDVPGIREVTGSIICPSYEEICFVSLKKHTHQLKFASSKPPEWEREGGRTNYNVENSHNTWNGVVCMACYIMQDTRISGGLFTFLPKLKTPNTCILQGNIANTMHTL